jgi:hypothetical protein
VRWASETGGELDANETASTDVLYKVWLGRKHGRVINCSEDKHCTIVAIRLCMADCSLVHLLSRKLSG